MIKKILKSAAVISIVGVAIMTTVVIYSTKVLFCKAKNGAEKVIHEIEDIAEEKKNQEKTKKKHK